MTDKLNLTKNEPSAQELSNSMRCMGYSLESAIADIVDNSITAKATEIGIEKWARRNNLYSASVKR